ncbi:MAG TPA: hypothetical protein PKA00_20910 [Saprospiraceae bacterium]|nr:hypothetical protein [Saprospiraceae bacterium]HMQ85384.1 hypothetical protein [Saprospiraceae bacterium]
MEALLDTDYNWGDFMVLILALLALYFVLRLMSQVLEQINFFGTLQAPLLHFTRNLLFVYELLAVILLSCAFVVINPLFNGLLLGVLLLGGFSYFKNYLSSLLLFFDRAVDVGRRISIGSVQGIITQQGRLGLFLQTAEGRRFVNYSQILSEGYTLVSGDEIGGFYELSIQVPEQEQTNTSHSHILLDLLATSPYLDRRHKPEIQVQREDPLQLSARILVRDENLLQELIALLKEWGYNAQIADA